MKFMKLLSLALSLGIVISLAACSSPTVTSTTTSTVTSTMTTTLLTTVTSTVTSPTTVTVTSTSTVTAGTTSSTSQTTSASGEGATFSQLAVKGQQSYNSICSRCHGSLFIGSAGPETLAKYKDAAKLLTKINSMPSGLSLQGSQEVLCYLLVENGFVTGETVFDAGALSQIVLQ
jgi:cytochrome c5